MVYWLIVPLQSFSECRPHQRTRWTDAAATVAVVGCLLAFVFGDDSAHARPSDFSTLTAHVEERAAVEKQHFGIASTCTNWFYTEMRRKPTPPAVEPIRWRHTSDRVLPAAADNAATEFFVESECPRRYPAGLDDARKAFAQAQSTLSIVLTFYEFALLADADDDRTYSSAELDDLVESMGLPTVTAQLDTGAVLRGTFDRWVTDRNLEQIMNAMSHLQERGYRVTVADRTQLERVMQ